MKSPHTPLSILTISLLLLVTLIQTSTRSDELQAGVGKVDITRPGHDAGANPPFVKALVLSAGETHAVIITVDAVAVAEIGSIRDPYLADLREGIEAEFGISPDSLLVNASHCHAVVATDMTERTLRAVREAWKGRVPVRAGAGNGQEKEIQINRRIPLTDGSVVDERHAYSLPPDDDVAGVGPIDPAIGILRLDRVDTGEPLALLYHFACHPIQGVPSGGNTADIPGFASAVIEENLGNGSAMALFLQGCGGDINPILYKSTARPRDGEPLGQRLGLSTLRAARTIKTESEAALMIRTETITVPRADLGDDIARLDEEVETLTKSLKGTTLDFERFLPLYVKYHLSGNYPSESAHQYLQDELLAREDWKALDENNRKALDAYLANIRTMEKITRAQINRALLEKHQDRFETEGDSVEAEVVGLRVGDFQLVTFPAEVTVEVGLEIKKKANLPNAHVSGYTNGYLYYAPTPEQMKNRGGAQEDSDCLLGPGWLEAFESTALNLLREM